MAPLPLVNLGFLVIKQVSKPFAKFIAAEAKDHKIFKDWVCIPIAQKFHFLEVVIKMRSLKPKRGTKGSGSRVTKVPALNEARAVELGSELLSEIIVLGISVSTAIILYNISVNKEIEKEERAIKVKAHEEEMKENKATADREALKQMILAVESKIDVQSKQIKQLIKETEENRHSVKELKTKLSQLPEKGFQGGLWDVEQVEVEQGGKLSKWEVEQDGS